MAVDFDTNAGSRPLKPRHFRKQFLSAVPSAAPRQDPEANRRAMLAIAPVIVLVSAETEVVLWHQVDTSVSEEDTFPVFRAELLPTTLFRNTAVHLPDCTRRHPIL
jgi:hypothetical protein